MMFVAKSSIPRRLLGLIPLLAGCIFPQTTYAAPPNDPAIEPLAVTRGTEDTSPAELAAKAESAENACVGGVVKDDGGVESGYGFVPTSTTGTYLQRFDSSDFSSEQLATVCICWLKTRGAAEIEFDVVFFEDAGGSPVAEPYAFRTSTATEIPRTKESAGNFYSVDVSGVEAPEGTFYIGARWNPSMQNFLFICNDRSDETQKTDVFFRENVQPAWVHVAHSRDPIFGPHRAIMVRANAQPAATEGAKPDGSIEGASLESEMKQEGAAPGSDQP